MPSKVICGIYMIETPDGSKYVGSSTNIYCRWGGHRYHLRRGSHHSKKLQAAFHANEGIVRFSIIELCAANRLNVREQFWVNELGASLNTTLFINNVWANLETRARLESVFRSNAYRKRRSEISSTPSARWVKVVCSDGRSFISMAEAARTFGVNTAAIRYLTNTQHLGKLGVSFRLENDEWRPRRTLSEKITEARKKNGTLGHSKETIAKFKAARVGWTPSRRAVDRSLEVNRKAVVGLKLETDERIEFKSARDAVRFLGKNKRASASISRVCGGDRPSAFGYRWSFAPVANGDVDGY